MRGYLTYTSIIAMVIVSLFGQFITESEAERIAEAVLILITAGIAVYGRFRATK